MNKIKIVIILIFIVSIVLAILSNSISQYNQVNNKILETLNKEKAFTQEISKNIFYTYKNKDASSPKLDDYIKNFIKNMQNNTKDENNFPSDDIKKQNQKIVILWNSFYLKVQDFKDLNKVTTVYSSIILEKILKDIYNLNIKLVVEFDKLINMNKQYSNETLKIEKTLQHFLYATLLALLIYLFTQLKTTISFIQKFLNTSKKIITNSTIKDLKPIEINGNTKDILQATNNFNFLVQKINDSIENSSKSIEYSYKSIELIEKNIEELLELFYEMQDDNEFDKDITKKEDALIQSLEELTTSAKKLQDLKQDLNNLIAQK